MTYEIVNGQKIACYDYGNDDVADRYTVFFLSWEQEYNNRIPCLAMGPTPFHPQGFCQHSSGVPGKHCGKRIAFSSLPPDCRRAVERDLEEE